MHLFLQVVVHVATNVKGMSERTELTNLTFTIYLFLSALASLRHLSVVSHSTETNLTKKADVIDLTLESSSSSSSDDERDANPPLKKQCIYMSKNEEMHAKE